jgi:hypothetical protein
MSSNVFVTPRAISTIGRGRIDHNTSLQALLQNFSSNAQPTSENINLEGSTGLQTGMLWYKSGTDSSSGEGRLLVYTGNTFTRVGITVHRMTSVEAANTAALAGSIGQGDLIDVGDNRLYMVNSSSTGVFDVGSKPPASNVDADTLSGVTLAALRNEYRANDGVTLGLARSNDGVTLGLARANDFATYTTLRSEYAANDGTTLNSARANDGATLNLARSNDGVTLNSARANDGVTLNLAFANDFALFSSVKAFNVISVAGQANVVASSFGSPIQLVAGANVTILTNPATNSITISSGTGGGGGTDSNVTLGLAYANDGVTLASARANDFTTWSGLTAFANLKANIAGPVFTGDITIPDKIVHAGDLNTAIRFPDNDTISLETNGLERFRVTSTGVTELRSGTGNFNIFASGAASAPNITLFGLNDSTNAMSSINQVSTGPLSVQVDPNNILTNSEFRVQIDGTTRMAVFSDSSTFSNDVIIPDKIVHAGDLNTAIRFPDNDTISLETNGLERFRVTSAGVTELRSGTGNFNLFASGGTNAPTITLFGTNDSTNAMSSINQVSTGPLSVQVDPNNILTNSEFRVQIDGTTRMSIFSNASTFSNDVIIPDKIVHADDLNTAIRFPANDTIAFETAGSERFRIAPDGNVGIRTTTANRPLEIFGSGNSLRFSATSPTSTGGIEFFNSVNEVANFSVGGGSGAITIESDPLNVQGSSGISLNVDGTTRITVSSNSSTFSNDVIIPDKIVHTGDLNTAIRFPENDTISLETNGLERFRVASTGVAELRSATGNLNIFASGAAAAPAITLFGINDSTNAMSSINQVSTGALSVQVDPNNILTNSEFRVQIDGTTRMAVFSNASTFSNDVIIPDKIVHADDPNTAIRFPANDTISLETNGLERFRVTSTGNVGIGTASANTLLEVAGVSSLAKIRLRSSNVGVVSVHNSSVNAAIELVSAGMTTTNKYTPAIKFGSDDPQLTTVTPKFGAAIVGEASEIYAGDIDGGMDLIFLTVPNNPGTTETVMSERMRIRNTGVVDVTSVSGNFNLFASGAVAAPNITLFGLNNTTNAMSSINQVFTGQLVISVDPENIFSNSDIRLETDSTTRMTITSNGATLTGLLTGNAVVQSNTDVTAGRLLTTLAGPAQAFRLGNILGTVSESGGVPTGVLIERGTNANGEYVRLADGTQVCVVNNLAWGSSIANGTGVTTDPYRTAPNTWTFPSSFIAAPVVVGSVRGDNATVARHHSFSFRTVSTTQITGAQAVRLTTLATDITPNIDITAIGRWF